jgi:hypothetical protein
VCYSPATLPRLIHHKPPCPPQISKRHIPGNVGAAEPRFLGAVVDAHRVEEVGAGGGVDATEGAAGAGGVVGGGVGDVD